LKVLNFHKKEIKVPLIPHLFSFIKDFEESLWGQSFFFYFYTIFA